MIVWKQHRLLCVGLLCGAVACASSTGNTSGSGGTGTSISCSDLTPTLTALPIDLSLVQSIIPLGTFDSSAKGPTPIDHLFFPPVTDGVDALIVAPADLAIYKILWQTFPSTGKQLGSVYLKICDDVTMFFSHVNSLNDTLAALLTDDVCSQSTADGESITDCNWEGTTTISAGETIGTTYSALDGGNFDWGMRDARTASTIDARLTAMMNGDEYVVCPVDYYTDATLKAALETKLQRERASTPYCGFIEAGTYGAAMGRWFEPGLTSYASADVQKAIGFFPAVRSDTVQLIAVRSGSGLQSGNYYFTYTSSGQNNRNFDDVTADGNTYCYDTLFDHPLSGSANTLAGAFYLQIVSATEMRVEFNAEASACLDSPNAFTFTSDQKTFHRL
jgi:hypothetical protein